MIGIRDLLCGVAVGDAIGYPLEFMGNPTKDDFEESVAANVLEASDDTQMTLFLAEAIAQHDTKFSPELPYTRWYITQINLKPAESTISGLLDLDCMYELRAPGNTCMSACASLSKGEKVVNNSKGNGTVMRISPWALKAAQDMGSGHPPYLPFVVRDSLTTHKHAEAAESAGALFVLLYWLLLGLDIETVLELVVGEVNPTSRTSELLLKAIHAESLEVEGWVAEEALHIAVRSVLNARNYLEAIHNASVIPGDSDTCAAIAGAIAVCAGVQVPEELVAKLDVLPAINFTAELWAVSKCS
jgi:ADP-ribosylglycohydrolase